jgi:hypothetical protein
VLPSGSVCAQRRNRDTTSQDTSALEAKFKAAPKRLEFLRLILSELYVNRAKSIAVANLYNSVTTSEASEMIRV